jgi:hypothetical protein
LKILISGVCAALIALAPATAAAEGAGPFGAGHTELLLTGGSGYAFNDSYLILGAGAAVYLVDGLNVGLGAQYWFGGTRDIYNVTPSIEYVFYQPKIKPYFGAFYRRTYIDGLPDLDSTGLRFGFYVEASRTSYFGFGLVHQRFNDCNSNAYIKCDSTYLEASLKFSF